MLSFFESGFNVESYLKDKFGSSVTNIGEISSNIALTMKTAREYYRATEDVTILTEPLLLFYGMSALCKVLFGTTHGKKSPSQSHGLKEVEGWTGISSDLAVRILKDGTFPQFHGCFCKDSFWNRFFSLKELVSLIPEVKASFETVYNEKSKALKVVHIPYGISLIDSELQKYADLEDLIRSIPDVDKRYSKNIQRFEDRINLFCINGQTRDPTIRAVSGEKYFVLPLRKGMTTVIVPEMSVHYLIAYLLGMFSRYHLKEWAELVEGKKSGEIYIIQKFLDTTKRKFPNMILNEIHNRNFFFTSPKIEVEEKGLSKGQLEEIYEYVSEKLGRELRVSGL
jgi:hypothetical protein